MSDGRIVSRRAVSRGGYAQQMTEEFFNAEEDSNFEEDLKQRLRVEN